MLSKTRKILSNCYNRKIKTDQNNEMTLYINDKNDKLFITCFYTKNYFKKTFSNSFSLQDLQKQLPYYNQFYKIKPILNEIINNQFRGSEYIKGNEEKSEEITLIIPLPSFTCKNISFNLKEKKKSYKEEYREYKIITNIYEEELVIANFNSKILIGKDKEKHAIKFWISPIHKISAKLIYSFYENFCLNNENEKMEINFNIGRSKKVRNFHQTCDNKKRILILFKSKNEIFGAYTPLSFNSLNKYGYDNESFLFSLNRLKKYPKNSFNKTKSIWCYKNYGPSFHYDLYFLENSMNVVELDKNNYLTSDNWINRKDCFIDSEGIILDSLEIFQIVEEDNNQDKINLMNYEEEEKIDDSDFPKDKINNNLNNINNENIKKNHNNEKNEIIINTSNTNSEIMNEGIKGDFNGNFPEDNINHKKTKKIKIEENIHKKYR